MNTWRTVIEIISILLLILSAKNLIKSWGNLEQKDSWVAGIGCGLLLLSASVLFFISMTLSNKILGAISFTSLITVGAPFLIARRNDETFMTIVFLIFGYISQMLMICGFLYLAFRFNNTGLLINTVIAYFIALLLFSKIKKTNLWKKIT